jgi:hypothetical protein
MEHIDPAAVIPPNLKEISDADSFVASRSAEPLPPRSRPMIRVKPAHPINQQVPKSKAQRRRRREQQATRNLWEK